MPIKSHVNRKVIDRVEFCEKTDSFRGEANISPFRIQLNCFLWNIIALSLMCKKARCRTRSTHVIIRRLLITVGEKSRYLALLRNSTKKSNRNEFIKQVNDLKTDKATTISIESWEKVIKVEFISFNRFSNFREIRFNVNVTALFFFSILSNDTWNMICERRVMSARLVLHVKNEIKVYSVPPISFFLAEHQIWISIEFLKDPKYHSQSTE